MKSKVFALAGVAGAMFVAGNAPAAYTGLVVERVDAEAQGWTELNGYVGLDTYRVYAQFDDNLGLITAVGDSDGLFELTSRDGSFFNVDVFGAGDFAPATAILDANPDAEWDTFVTIGVAADPMFPSTGGAVGFTTQAMGLVGDTTLNNTGWFIEGFPDQGNASGNRVLVAQLTVNAGIGVDGRNWRVSGLAVQGGNPDEVGFDVLSNFSVQTIPAPGAVALLGLAGLVSSRRRRG